MAMDTCILLKLNTRAPNVRSYGTAIQSLHRSVEVNAKVIAIKQINLLEDEVAQLQWSGSV